jgi:hypothetical protein
MDLSLILGLIGTIATIIFGFLSIDLFRRKKYPGKVTYVELSVIDLLNNVANNFKEIELLHNKTPINKNIVYVKGALINNGDIDINSKLTEKDITIELPLNCKWLDIKATDFSKGLNVSVNINGDNSASFKFDLFRKEEFVQFEGLIETKDDNSNSTNSHIKFTHRIENTSQIEKKVLLTNKEIKKKKSSAIIYSTFLLVLLAAITATSMFNIFGSKKESIYFKRIGDTTNVFYSVKQNDGLAYLDAYNGGYDFTLKIEEFSKNYEATNQQLTFGQKFKDSYWMITIQLALFLFIVLRELIEIRTANKLNKIFKK